MIGVVEVFEDDNCVVVMLMVATLIAVVEVDDVILTEPLFCLLGDEDVLFALAFNIGWSFCVHWCTMMSRHDPRHDMSFWLVYCSCCIFYFGSGHTVAQNPHQ